MPTLPGWDLLNDNYDDENDELEHEHDGETDDGENDRDDSNNNNGPVSPHIPFTRSPAPSPSTNRRRNAHTRPSKTTFTDFAYPITHS